MLRPAVTRPRLGALIAVAAIAAGVAGAAEGTHAVSGLEHDSVRLRFETRHEPKPTDVAVVAIDDATFSDLRQQWPFKRSLHGRVVKRLHAAGAREIVYDVQFTEPTTPREDGALYDALGSVGGAVLVTGESDGKGHANVLGGDANLRAVRSRAAAGDLANDSNGTITHYPRSVGGLDTVAVAAAARASGRTLPRAAFQDGQAWIDYRGGPGTIPTVPFSSVVRGRFDPALVRGKVVVVGAASPTLQDVHPTPIGGDRLMAGPEVQANAIWTALHGNPLRSAGPAVGWLLIALMALLAPLVRLRLRIVATTAVALAAGVAFAAAAQLAFDSGTVLTAITPLLALLVGTVGTIVASHLAESFERRRVARDNEVLEARVRERTAELRDTQLEVIRRLGAAVESRDYETGEHISRMSLLCHRLALAIGLDAAQADLIKQASAMHDIGKIGIPDRILQKPGPLDPDEWVVMKTHTTVGAGILSGSNAPLIQMAETIARTHHERWDGSGYPAGTAGEETPLPGRIAAICDVFDALISQRPYKRAWSVDEALAEIAAQAGEHFDPALVGPFVELAREQAPHVPEASFPADALLAAATSERG